MRALAIETSGRVGSIAVVDGGNVLEEREFAHGLKHAAGIVPLIDELCRARGWRATDLDEIYVSAGPGSFTGLRIGITFAKTLAMAVGVKIVAAPTVRVLVENAPPQATEVIIVLDAKRDQIFTAALSRQGDHWQEREAAHLDSLVDMLARAPRPVWLVGEGLPYHEKFLPRDQLSGTDSQGSTEYQGGIIVSGPEFWRARAAAVAKVGYAMARAGQFADPLALAPLYIRLPEAEEKRLAREQSSCI
jgi:tRNA threonylcarbamoyladenosine biosynthesis protein TsaB